MLETVKPRRGYRSSRRSAQAAETRAAVIDAARDIFMREGWQKATIVAIARRAGVSVETIYAGFGTKRVLLEAVIASAVRGPEPETPLMDQTGPRAVLEEKDQRRQLMLFAAGISLILERVAPLMAVVRAAAETEREAGELYAGVHRGRRQNFAVVVDSLLTHGPMRVDRDAAITTIARLSSPELFLLATRVEGTSREQFEAWLADALIVLLLRGES